MQAQNILDFWFKEIDEKYWFTKSEAFDRTLHERFFDIWQVASKGELTAWRKTLQGRLAEIIILDQFSRNLNRQSPKAFAQDELALQLAFEAIKQAGFASMNPTERHFMLMPLMHSESAQVHEQAIKLFEQYAPQALDFEYKHKVIIDRFGRYPHRNAILGRESTAEELEFLTQEGSSF